MSHHKTPLDAVAELEAAMSGTALRLLLQSHASGLQTAAALIGDMAEEVAIDQRMPQEQEERDSWKPEKWTPDQAHAVSRVLSDLNTKIMARIKAVDVSINEPGGA